jgi:hypothetical protein
LKNEVDRLIDGHRATFDQVLAQVCAGQVLHHQVRSAALEDTNIEDRRNVLALDADRCLSFANETIDELGGLHRRRQEFDRDLLTKLRVHGRHDDAHAANADHALDFVFSIEDLVADLRDANELGVDRRRIRRWGWRNRELRLHPFFNGSRLRLEAHENSPVLEHTRRADDCQGQDATLSNRLGTVKTGVFSTVLGALFLSTFFALAQPAQSAPAQPAQPTTSTDRVVAEALFREGRELMEANKVSEACAKFAESYRIDRALGTLINLALCHEKEGKTASAWAEFNEAAADAAAEHDDREAFARKHIAALASELPRLSLTIAPATVALSTLEIKLDGHAVGKAAWSSSLPIDPGDHDLQASADGKRPYLTKFSVKKGAGTTSVAVPVLDDAPKQPVNLTPPPPEQPAPPSTQRTIGYIATGVGVVGILGGAAFGLTAISAKSDRDARCDANNLCDQEGLDKDKDARSAATISTIGFIAGGVLTAGGLFLVFTAPKAPKAPPPSTSARLGLAGSGVFVRGTF